jgi:hypothetical protein
VVVQPALGRTADIWGYPSSYVASAAIQLLALPFIVRARRERASSDPTTIQRPLGGTPGSPRRSPGSRRDRLSIDTCLAVDAGSVVDTSARIPARAAAIDE